VSFENCLSVALIADRVQRPPSPTATGDSVLKQRDEKLLLEMKGTRNKQKELKAMCGWQSYVE